MGISLQAERLCEVLLQQGPGCTWALDRDFSFARIFGNCVPVFGRTAGEIAGLSLSDILPAETRELWRERAARVFRGETVVLRERFPAGLFSITQYPLRGADGSIVFAAGAAYDVTPWKTAEEELRNTALNVLKAQEVERGRLCRFLHDEVGQCLSAAGLQLDLLRMDLEREVPDIVPRTAEVQQLLERVMERVREFTYELNPAMVERAGLYSALDRLAGRMRRQFPGTLRLMADSSLRVEEPAATALYKIAEQAVENAMRHSGCTLLEVLLKTTRLGPVLEVRDNGAGFDAADAGRCRRGLGLLIMEHCAAETGIDLAVSSSRGRGTTVRAACTGRRPGAED